MSNITQWSLPGANDQLIYGNTHLPASPRGVLIMAHGFKGYKDYGFMPYLAQQAANQNLIVHRFNFSHSGMTHHADTFERPDLFEQNTWGKQVEDLLAMIQHLRQGKLEGGQLPVTWFGHSRGGTAALLAASQCDTDNTPAKVIAAAAPHSAWRMDNEEREMMHRQGYLESPSARTGQRLRVGKVWLDYIEQNPKKVDPLNAISNLRMPVLLINGDKDGTVLLNSGQMLHSAGGNNVTLQVVQGANHVFNATNPMEANEPVPKQTTQLVKQTLDFCLAS